MGIRSLRTASISTGTKRSKVWDQSAVYAPSSYESIATVAVGSSSVGSVTFSSIPQTYKHLQVRGIVRSDRATTIEGVWAYYNSDTTNSPGSGNYTYHVLLSDGSSMGAGASVPTQGGVLFGMTTCANLTSGVMGSFVADILDYTDTNKFTVSRGLTGTDANNSGNNVRLTSGVWRSTAAITAIKFDTQGGGNWTQYSHFALYGIKG